VRYVIKTLHILELLGNWKVKTLIENVEFIFFLLGLFHGNNYDRLNYVIL